MAGRDDSGARWRARRSDSLHYGTESRRRLCDTIARLEWERGEMADLLREVRPLMAGEAGEMMGRRMRALGIGR